VLSIVGRGTSVGPRNCGAALSTESGLHFPEMGSRRSTRVSEWDDSTQHDPANEPPKCCPGEPHC